MTDFASEVLLGTLPLQVPAGYGFQFTQVVKHPDDLYDRLLIWEPPRRDQLYVMSVDVGDGIGQDRSVVDITRVGTVKEPDEQVAQWVSAWTDPLGLAPIVDAIGRFYQGSDGQEAMAAIECNNHGLVTQSELQRHLGYNNMFVWEYLDTADPDKAKSTRIGWWTTVRTRPLILARYLKKLKAVDKHTGRPDYLVNSPLTIQELRTFRTLGGIREAEADPADSNAHDDCIMCGAIGVHVSSTLQYSAGEPVDMARRRLQEEKARQAVADAGAGRDFINTDCTADEMAEGWAGAGAAQDRDFIVGTGGY
jgi:hypothetical protein